MSVRWLDGKRSFTSFVVLLLLAAMLPAEATAEASVPLLSVLKEGGGEDYSVNLQLLLILTGLTLLPAILMASTSFLRILIVLSILKQAVGLQQIPPPRVLVGIALILTLFVMRPVYTEVWERAVSPYIEEKMAFKEAVGVAILPMHRFMRKHTRRTDLEQFMYMADTPAHLADEEIPLTTLMPAFLCSELKTGFVMGFLVFLPFLIIDLIVASLLMALGMIMLSPLVISLPLKVLLFVLVDGWGLVIASLVRSFDV